MPKLLILLGSILLGLLISSTTACQSMDALLSLERKLENFEERYSDEIRNDSEFSNELDRAKSELDALKSQTLAKDEMLKLMKSVAENSIPWSEIIMGLIGTAIATYKTTNIMRDRKYKDQRNA